MELEELFIHTVDDLRTKVEAGDDYSILRATALLRQLLMDGHSLTHQVNRTYRIRLGFEVCGRSYRDIMLSTNPDFYSSLDGIHKSGLLAGSVEPISLDQLLSEPVLVSDGQVFTVGDLIRHGANVDGGVHRGQPRNDLEQALSDLANGSFMVAGQAINYRQLRPIALIMLDGLEPVYKTISSGQQ